MGPENNSHIPTGKGTVITPQPKQLLFIQQKARGTDWGQPRTRLSHRADRAAQREWGDAKVT